MTTATTTPAGARSAPVTALAPARHIAHARITITSMPVAMTIIRADIAAGAALPTRNTAIGPGAQLTRDGGTMWIVVRLRGRGQTSRRAHAGTMTAGGVAGVGAGAGSANTVHVIVGMTGPSDIGARVLGIPMHRITSVHASGHKLRQDLLHSHYHRDPPNHHRARRTRTRRAPRRTIVRRGWRRCLRMPWV